MPTEVILRPWEPGDVPGLYEATVENRGRRCVAEKAGATRDGGLRGRLFPHGVAHDTVSYSLVDPTPRRPTDDMIAGAGVPWRPDARGQDMESRVPHNGEEARRVARRCVAIGVARPTGARP